VIRAHPFEYARVVVSRAAAMLSYAAAGPPLLAEGAMALVARAEDDGPEEARIHDLARRPEDDRFLGLARPITPLRPVLAAAQAVLVAVLTPLALLGAALLLALRWRSSLVLLSLPLYYLCTESFFLYEWRVAVPMHYPLMACAAAALVLPVALAGSARRVRRDQNQAG
jgi:hypothetical protein